MALSYSQIKHELEIHKQIHLLSFWEQLTEQQRQRLLAQFADLDWDAIAQMRRLLAADGSKCELMGGQDLEPAQPAVLQPAERREALARGGETLRAGQVGVLLVAGGQGTRLGFDGPKGTYTLGPISGMSLFAIHARKILALERRHRTVIPFYIMTSLANDTATRQFFQAHNYFGLRPANVLFFIQGQFPAFWPDGRIVLEDKDRISMAPDGHGGVLAALKRTGMADDMRQRGLTTLFYFQVDNPLVEIADSEFIGIHQLRQAQMSLKVCAKRGPEEGLGVVVRRGNRYAMVEYTELTREQKFAALPNGELKFKYGSVAIHIFSLDFMMQEAAAGLPLHRAYKKVACCDEHGRLVKPDQPNAYKFEKFIFDALPDAERVLLLAFAREAEFSPVKNATGNDSPDQARQDMMNKFASWMAKSGVAVPRWPDGRLKYRLEIDPCWAMHPDDLRRQLPAGFCWDRELYLAEGAKL